MQKYGIECFTITILEECSKEELNNKEQYWIKMFNATDKQIGYNLTEGGQNNFALKGEQHSQAKLTQVQVNEIYELLKNSDLSFPDVAAYVSALFVDHPPSLCILVLPHL